MKLHRNSLLAAAGIVLVLYLVTVIVGLPVWAAVVMAVVLLVVLAVVWRQPEVPRPVVGRQVPKPAPSVVLPEPEPVFSGPPSRTVADVRLPSASPDFQFSFSAIVQWSTVLSGSRHADLGAVAVDALLERARSLTARQQVTEESLNQHRLAAILGEPALDEKGQVRSWATEVRLRLPDADQKHLHHLAALHRREQTTLLERRMEQDKRAYLKDDVFSSPGSAAVWWLVNHPGEVQTAVGMLDTLTDLSAAANDLPVRRATAEQIERQQPTRAELAFSTAIENLTDPTDPAAQADPVASAGLAVPAAPVDPADPVGPAAPVDPDAGAAGGSPRSNGLTASADQRPVVRRDSATADGRHETGPSTSDQRRAVKGKADLDRDATEEGSEYREQFFSE
ncbi:hypothetical protein PWY87_10780 [Kribbella solani]|uniref:hypothetical protein n=1 Tax=Kribbella solani TaxID=236067 RepID=UPI0029B19048|nr:hypothetical protein [Kribbella solani]MDX3002157.1 hypothetical protein [Kribbella solani]